MGESFLDLARQGKNVWWRYLLAILTIFLVWICLSAWLSLLFVWLDTNPHTYFDLKAGQFVEGDALSKFILFMLPFVALGVGLLVAVRIIHRRPFRSLITPQPSFDWRRVGKGFGVWLGLIAASSLIEAALYPGRYQLTVQVEEFLRFLPVVLILVPLQTTVEELLFRGYVMQSLRLVSRQPLVPAVGSSVLFLLIHGWNPEVQAYGMLILAYYFGIGLLLALITLRDNRLELAIGVHAATSLFIALVANYPQSVLPTPALSVSTLDVPFSLASFVVCALIFYVGVFGWKRGVSAEGEGDFGTAE